MQTRSSPWRSQLWLVASLVGAGACARGVRSDTPASTSAGSSALVLKEQGSFAVGGTVVTNPGTFDPYKPTSDGATLHGDHAYVFYQVPVDARPLPLVLWHGAGQFSKTWETTPDGREGFQTIFLRRRFAVYVLDQPRRGNAGRSTVPLTIPATPDDQIWFGMFRLGVWPDLFPGVQFSRDPEALNQFFRSMTPNTGPFDMNVSSDAVSALFAKIGPGILVTHSQGGGPGWLAAMKNPNVRAVVSYEPGSGFVFPEGEVPAAMPSLTGPLEGIAVPLSRFMALTKIPIVLYFGDNIPEAPSTNPGQDNWRVRIAMARLWRDAVNRHGGDVTLVHLPELGIRGNTHFAFSDLNNVEIADLLSKFLADKHLDSGDETVRTEGLSVKQQRIVGIAAFTANGDLPKLKVALGEGLDVGWTINEIKEILVQMYAYAGFPRSLNGLNTFIDVLEERQRKGIADAVGREPSPMPAGKSSIDLGTEIQAKLVGGPATGRYLAFCPTIDAFLKGHLFGDILGRDNLDLQSREIATISALAALEGVNPQLTSHLNVGLNVGLTQGQLRSMIAVIEEKVGKTRGDNAAEVLDQVIRKRQAGPPVATPPPSGAPGQGSPPHPTIHVERKDAQPVESAPAEHFTGSAQVQRLFEASDPARASGASVTFAPGARTAWHAHPLGQTLIVTAGTGWVQQWGEQAQRIAEGNVVWIPPSVKHWHGAASTTAMTHIAIQEQLEGKTVQWMEQMSDEEYRAAERSR